jgi:hypothetical protein
MNCFLWGFFHDFNSGLGEHLENAGFRVGGITFDQRQNYSTGPSIPYLELDRVISHGEHLSIPVPLGILSDLQPIQLIAFKMYERFDPVSEIHGVPSPEKILTDYLNSIKFFTWLIDKFQFSFAIFSNVPHEFYDYIFYHILKARRIPVLSFYVLPSRPQNFFGYAFEDIDRHSEIAEEFLDNLGECKFLPEQDCFWAFENAYALKPSEFSSFTRNKEVVSLFHIDKKLRLKGGVKENLKKIPGLVHLKRFIQSSRFYRRTFLNDEKLFLNLLNLFQAKAFQKGKDILEQETKSKVDLNCAYLYFPLHYQPEASTCPLAGIFAWQENVIDYLCSELPQNISIVVKEHPRPCKKPWLRNEYFYKRLTSNPRVKIVDVDVHPFELIDNSIAVVTCSGSVGMEAIFRKKQVLCFGERFYTCSQGVHKIDSIPSLRSALELVLGNNHNLEILWDSSLKDFGQKVNRHCFPLIISPKDRDIFQGNAINNNQNICLVVNAWIKSLRTRNLL